MRTHSKMMVMACSLCALMASAFAQEQLAVVNTAGEVWARDVLPGRKIGPGVKLTGPSLFGGPDAKFVVGSRTTIGVITESGRFWRRQILAGNVITAGVEDARKVAGVESARYALYAEGCDTVYMIDARGNVTATALSGSRRGDGRMGGPPLFGGPNDKYVVLDGDRILVINTAGEVWAHEMDKSNGKFLSDKCSYDLLEPGYRLQGPSLFGASNDKYVVCCESSLYVINDAGEVWERSFTGTSIDAGTRLQGPSLFGGDNHRDVLLLWAPPP